MLLHSSEAEKRMRLEWIRLMLSKAFPADAPSVANRTTTAFAVAGVASGGQTIGLSRSAIPTDFNA